MIERVVRQCHRAMRLSEVVVATDDGRIARAVERLCRVEMTSSRHGSGTERVAEAAARIRCDGVVNVQGDEPLIDPEVIDTLAQGLEDHPMTTAAARISSREEYLDPAVPKVVLDREGRALYFSRRTIPAVYPDGEGSPWEDQPFYRHIGVYGFRSGTLKSLVSREGGPLERLERLEQLRALEHRIAVQVYLVDSPCAGVDHPEDIAKVESLIEKRA